MDGLFGVALSLLSVPGAAVSMDLDEQICRKLACSLGQISEVGQMPWGLVSLPRRWVRSDQTPGLQTGRNARCRPAPQNRTLSRRSVFGVIEAGATT